MQRTPRTSTPSWLKRILSLLAVCLVLQPLSVVSLSCLGSTAAAATGDVLARASGAADDCCPDAPRPAGDSSDDAEGGEHEDCPCPFRCALGCGAQARAIVAASALPEVSLLVGLVRRTPHHQRTPSNPEPFGILHVPKAARG